MNIVLAASEAFPFCKTGGLADVVGAITQEFSRARGAKVLLMLPYYRKVKNTASLKAVPGTFLVPVGTHIEPARLFYLKWGNTLVFFIHSSRYFDRPGFYNENGKDYRDNDERFIFFSRAVLEACKFIGFKPDIVHAHDWQTGLIPAYLETLYKTDAYFARTRSIFTVHNIAYQGYYPKETFDKAGFWGPDFTPDKFEYWGGISFLKAGIVFSTRVNTVSPTYAKELLNGRNSFGLEGVLHSKGPAFCGILNGLDIDVWDPQNDNLIPMGYDEESMQGKTLCKTALQKELGLEVNENIPLFVMVSRLTYQKGIDLVSSIVPALAGKVQFAFLGKGEQSAEQNLKNLAASNPRYVAFCGAVDENLAHKVYAAGDFYLMPSRFEPCGLSQMIAMRYGTLPVVTRTGGLADTVIGFTDNASLNKATGFFVDNFDPNALIYAINRALQIYSNKSTLNKMRENAMMTDFSWDNSSAAYLKLYENALSLGARW